MRQTSDRGSTAIQYSELRAERQKLLVDFIRAELGISFTFLRSAELAAAAEHLDHARGAKANARKAADSVRQFLSQVSDRAIRDEIRREFVKLEKQIG